jgi:hypothetical protein
MKIKIGVKENDKRNTTIYVRRKAKTAKNERQHPQEQTTGMKARMEEAGVERQ